MDVLALGAVAIDTLLYVDAWPTADTKISVQRSMRQCGGLSATALVAAARLGASCAYAGLLGADGDADSDFASQAMCAEGIDLTHVVHERGAGPVRSTIVVGAHNNTRNIFTEHPARTGADESRPSPELIRSARVLHVDHIGIPGMTRAARIARDAGVAVVSDVEREEFGNVDELFTLIDHLITSEEFALRRSGAADAAAAALALWTPARRCVAVTTGAHGCVFTLDGLHVQSQPALAVNVVDTTGCGDVFHGAYCAMLARGTTIIDCIHIAATAASLKATRPGAQAGAPSWNEVMSQIRKSV
ncbi:MAG: PfkB family carbohydrate kinase [Chloroflexi bacterium]|nr:PfkB family carbohydrate kinase [Chloroflexota bacterium]